MFGCVALAICLAGCQTNGSSEASSSYGNWCGAGSSSEFAKTKPIDKLDSICRAHDACCEVSGYEQAAGGSIVKCTAFCNDALKWNLKQYRAAECSGKNAISKQCGMSLIGSVYTAVGQKETEASLLKVLAGANIPKAEPCTMARMLALNSYDAADPIAWSYGPTLEGDAKTVAEGCK